MITKTIGIIGNGFVGSAVAEGFKLHSKELKIFDKDPTRSAHSLEEVLGCDFVFVCVPTPMSNSGACDLSILKSLFLEIDNFASDAILLIKSTVPIGTTQELQEKFPDLCILHSPEFLTARTALLDFITPARIIIGHPFPRYLPTSSPILSVISLFKERFPGKSLLSMTSNESEMVKYIANCFFATKISFFNEMYLLADKLGLNWENIMGGVLSDGRIGASHFQVPGHDGDYGFGGTCFPKDINSLITLMNKNNIEPHVLKGAWQQNLNVRKHKDWEYSPSAVSQPKKEKD